MKLRIWIGVVAAVLSASLLAQEGDYYYGVNWIPVQNEEDALEWKEVKKRSGKRFRIVTHRKLMGEWVQTNREKIKIQNNEEMVIYQSTDGYFPKRVYREMKKIDPHLFEFKESTLHQTLRTGTSTSYFPLHLEGIITEYHLNGELKSRSEYRDNQLISNENWLSDGSRYIDSIFYSADIEPEYQMGDEFFKSYLLEKLSASPVDLTQIEDQVVIGWVVMENGHMEGVMALKGKSRLLNEFLVHAISELPGTWTPAVLNGNPIRYYMSIPLNFISRDTNFQDITFSGNVMHYSRY